jgi:beta-glucosidase
MENNRLYYNVQVSNRTMREIYAPAFKACVQEAGALGIMAAYNKVNGFFCTENKTIITDLLKNEWGFQGFVVSDWGATHSTTNAANGGLDIEMPGGAYFGTPLSAAAAQGGVLQSVIDDKVRRVLKAKIWAGVIDGPIQQYTSYLNCNEHKALALEAGRASIILAKNDANTLPLNASALSSIAVIGPYADAARVGGGGSSEVTPFYSVSPRQGIINKLGAAKVTSDYTKSDVAIVFVGVTGETEGSDRASPGIAVDQNALVNSVINAGKRCIVVFTGGSAAIAGDWSSAQAVVIAFYPGQEQGNAIADVLFGDYNPAGKLPVTFPQSADQLPAFDVNYEIADEGRGYRYFDKHQLNPLYPFGHGLSYTQFTYNTMSITPATVHVGDRITVNVSITNTGSRAGTEIVQLYIGDPSASLPRPVKELKGFSRVTLTPGQSGIASMEIGEDDLSFYNESAGSWVVEPGDIKLLVGASSRDIRLSQTISVQ